MTLIQDQKVQQVLPLEGQEVLAVTKVLQVLLDLKVLKVLRDLKV